MRSRSLQLLTSEQHESGALPAATDFSVYRDYCWFRDGSFIADALSESGQPAAASAFHRWCSDVIEDRTKRIEDLVERKYSGLEIVTENLLPTRYTLAGGEDQSVWWNFQMDGYGTWLFMLDEHLDRHDLSALEYVPACTTVVKYLSSFGESECFDWWEEFEEELHISTLGSVLAGLRAVPRLLERYTADSDAADGALRDGVLGGTAEVVAINEMAQLAAGRIETIVSEAAADAGHLPKWVGSTEVDGSLLSCLTPFEVVKPGEQIAERTYQKIVDDLLTQGVYRYIGDTFFGGGEWIILTAWLGLYELETGRLDLARKRLSWIVEQAEPNGDLPEQVDSRCQFPARIQEWQDRWGTVATPLLWSHAMFLKLDNALNSATDNSATDNSATDNEGPEHQ